MTAPRQIIAGETYLITRRCTQRQYLLRPDPITTAIFEYCLAEAASRHHIGLVAWKAMGNHYHAVVHDPRGRLPAFLEHFHKMLAKAMNARWRRWENFWSSEETCVTRLVTAHDILEKVLYVLCNAIAADLVDRLGDWPGASSLSHLDGKESTHRRPAFFFKKDGAMPESVVLRMTLTPCITNDESPASWRARCREALDERERTIREQRSAQQRRVMGRKRVICVAHTGAPESATNRGGLRPAIACKDAQRRLLELAALKNFRAMYKLARERWSAGDRRVAFPIGTYQLLSYGVRCSAPPVAA